jgi:hypothetical protein
MSVLLYLLGILSTIGGVAAIVFGIPVKEFSFGNTLILAGTTGLVGGLIIIGLAAAISQLHRIGEMLGARPLAKAGRMEPFEAPEKIPFPPKPKAQRRETPPVEPPPVASAVEERRETEPAFPAPSLRNPDVPLMGEEEARELPLSPRDAESAEPAEFAPTPKAPESTEQGSFEPAWRSSARQSESAYFEKMWPAEERSPPPQEQASWSESVPRGPAAPEPQPEPEAAPQEEAPVAILKSGVVDGMGYTLYIDGSIEAELPDGTLRFASINELRRHLEENSRG